MPINSDQLTFFFYNNRDEAIIDKHTLAHIQHFDDVLVVNPQDILRALLLVFIINCNFDCIAQIQLNFSGCTLHR